MEIIKNNLIIICFLLLLSACNHKDIFYEEYIAIENKWDKYEPAIFEVEQADTISKYNLTMNIRANKDYPFSNLFVIFKITLPDNSKKIDTLEYQMANSDGSLLGSGFSDIKESRLSLKPDYIFPISGKYKFEIEQAVRFYNNSNSTPIEGITHVGIRIERSK